MKFSWGLFAAFFVFSVASAAPESPASDSEPIASAESTGTIFETFGVPKTRFTGTFLSRFYGPSVTEWGDLQPDLVKGQSQNAGHPIQTENKFNIGYRVSDMNVVGAGIDVWEASRTGSYVDSPYLYFKKKELAQAGGYNLDGQVSTYFGVNPGARAYGTLGAIRLTEDSSYRFPGTLFMADIYAYLHEYIPETRTAGTKAESYFLVSSMIYQWLPKLSVNLSMKIWANRKIGRQIWDIDHDPIVMGPGLTWDILKTFAFNPYVDFSPGNRFSLATASVGCSLMWKIL